MAVALALGSALLFGLSDFSGGFASRRSAVTAVILVSQLAGLAVLATGFLLVPAVFDPQSFGWGAAAGIAGGTGLLFFYRALATGSMSVVAPLTAVASAIVPVLGGLALGERPPVLALLGVVVALAAVALVSAEGGRFPTPRQFVRGRSTLRALLAGTMFGLFFLLLSRSAPASGLWPLAGARLATVTLVLVLAATFRRPVLPSRAVLPLALASGVGDMGANVLFLLATREGLLTLTSVLAALYPASTVVLARLVLKERIARVQGIGMATAAAAVVLITVA